MNKNRVVPRWLIAIMLLVFFGVALYIRIAPAYGQVFVGDNVKFNTNDAYYFLRYIDNFVHNFPHHISFDPYLNYPTGYATGPINFFVYLLGGLIWLIGLGSPSVHLVNLIAAYFPAVVGALTVIAVYFIGKALFERKVGLIAAALIAILPGEYLGRSILGSTDRDALEVLLTTTTMLFLILAFNSARKKQLTFHSFSKERLPALTAPIVYSVLSGILLGLSVLTWRGSFIFALIILLYVLLRSILAHMKYQSFDYLSFTCGVTFLIGLVIFAASSRNLIYSAALVISLLVPLILSGLSWGLSHRKMKPFYFPLGVIGVGLVGLVFFYVASPPLFRSMLHQFDVFIPTQVSATVLEMQPMLFSSGHWTFSNIWGNYTTAIILSIIVLGILFYRFLRRDNRDQLFIILWSLITLLGMLVLRRIAPFFAINAALLTGYFAVIIYYAVNLAISLIKHKSSGNALLNIQDYLGSKVPVTDTPKIPQKPYEKNYYETLGVPRNATHKQIKKAHAKLTSVYQSGGNLTDEGKERLKQIDQAYTTLSDPQKRAAYDRLDAVAQRKDQAGAPKRGGLQATGVMNVSIAGLLIFFLIFFPNIKPASDAIAQETAYAPDDAWCDALTWLKNNTPEPFGKADYYYQYYKTPFQYPDGVYTVAAWWDYGYWILRIGQRIPDCDPGAGARETVARFFTAQNETEADKIADALKIKYVIIDGDTIINKYPNVATYAGISSDQFIEIYSAPSYNNRPVNYFYPPYFQSMAARLYYYNGKDVTSTNTSVISYVEKKDKNGVPYKEITDTKTFSTYEEAAAFVAKQPAGNYKIANYLPPTNPISLKGLQHYKLVYSSSQNSLDIPLNWNIPAVKIFEFIK
jgi:oligosaccharyl transferase (archaeosortase A-associated)